MNWRHELKFAIDEATFHHLYFSLRPVMHGDRHANGDDPSGFRGYQIRSLYFDDIERSGIFEKLAGVNPRHKYRIRIYNDNDQVIHLEKKIKNGELTQKRTCRLSREQVDGLLNGQPEAILEESLMIARTAQSKSRRREGQLLLQFYTEIRNRLLAPMLLVDYDRIPLVWPDGNVRITFDRHLSTGIYRQDLWDPSAALLPVLEPGFLIMEVKYDHFLPDFIRSLLQLNGISQLAVSKYVQCAGTCSQHNWEDQI
jgi:hypothetical protein